MAGKKITELSSGSLSNLPLSGVTTVVYSGLTLQHTLSDLRLKLVDSGSHNFTGNQTITGSLLISGSATYDIDVIGSIRTSGPNTNILVSGSTGRSHIGQHEISIISNSNSPYLSTEFGGNLGVFNLSNLTEIGLALNGSEFSNNWSNGPVLYVNNDSEDSYDAVFGFQNKTGYTDGRITLLKNTDLSGSLIVTGGVTGSFRGDGSGLTGITATLPSGVVSGSQQIVDFGFATTGSNTFIGNQVITGSVLISGSAANDLTVIGKILTTGPTAITENTDGVNSQYMGVGFGGSMGLYNISNNTEIGLALDGGTWTSNWSNGPIMYVNNTPGDTYEGVFGFQNKSNYTDGRITALKPMVFNSGSTVTGSFNVTGSSTLSGNNGFPLNVDGTINSKRLHFDKNPFNNDPSSNLGALRLDGFNQTFYLTNYDLADFANKQSVVGLFVNTGSNTANTYLESLYNGTNAKVELTNVSGSRTFRVDVDSSAITGSLTVSGGVTGSFRGDGSGLTGITASAPDNVATTGSNIFIGNQTITGSVLISGSAFVDLRVVGNIEATGSGASIFNTNAVNTEYFGSAFGGSVGVYDNSNLTEIGLALDGASWTGNWSNGPILYVNNSPGDTYDAAFGFQNKANFTDGRITALKPMVFISGVTVTGSMNVSGSVNHSITGNNITVNGNTRMEGNNGFPLTVDGTISTKRFAFNGNPFNSTIGGTFGSLNYDGNNTLLQYVNGDFGTPQTASYTYLLTDTGSNVTNVRNGAAYAGTTAETSLSNNNGVRTFNVNVDSTTVTGSLTVSGSISTGINTVDIRAVTSGSIDLSLGNSFIVLDDNNPAGGHLTFTNHREGQQVTVLLNTNAGSQTITLTGALRIVGGNSLTLNNSGYSIFIGVCYGGVFYGNFQSA
jgi:hypothetical protein